MVNGLQVRLLGGFIAVLLIALGLMGVVLILVLFARPVVTDALYNDLAATSVQTNFGNLVANETWRGLPPRQRRQLLEESLLGLQATLDAAAADTTYRILVTSIEGHVLYDSSEILTRDDQLRITEQQPLRNSIVENRRALFDQGRLQTPGGEEWLFVARPLFAVPRDAARQGENSLRLDYIVMAPQPEQTLRRVLADFGETFLLPLMQAGMLSFGVAILLSYWITRSVARPLAHIANAAGQVAAGDYAQRVPVQGVTEARVVAQAFNDMTAQVQATQKAQQDFLANVSHDLRTPLTSIQGYSQAIMDGVTDDPAHSASIINYEAARLTRLVQDLLDIARIQSGRMQMLRQAIALDGILRNVGESLNIKARDANITLHLDIQPLPRIAGDGDRLAQVFTNLVDNALKHTSEGGQVWLRAEPQAQGIMVTVQDTGEGIPKDDLARIFERFYQVDKSRQRGAQRIGTGLGLAIVNEIVRAHGGTVTVASQVGVGTAFQVWLPQLTADRSTVVFRRS